jgi:polyhydroxyalkanoate synthesis regulator phasin
MPPVPDWKRALDTGAHFTEVRRSQARKLASDLVAQGQLARNQVSAYVDDLVERSKRTSEQFRTIVRSEVERQLGAIGVATTRDLDALERRLRAANATKSTRGAGTKPSLKKTAAKRAPAKKKTASKSAAKKPAAKRTRTAS